MNLQSLKTKATALKAKLEILYLAFQDKRTPWYAKALIAMVIAYALSPIDLIPDFIPVLGYLDDLLLIPAGIALVIKLIPANVLLDCKEKQATQSIAKKYSLYGGLLVIAIWAFIVYLVFRAWQPF